jgi:DNA-directed RNA polymerase subunit RPC12/RpoP
MPSDSVSVSFNCKGCGAKLSWPDDAIDSTEISCSNCGKYFGTYRDLRDAAMDATKAKVESMIKDVLKGR